MVSKACQSVHASVLRSPLRQALRVFEQNCRNVKRLELRVALILGQRQSIRNHRLDLVGQLTGV